MLRVDNISKKFSNRKAAVTALKNVSLEIKDGEFLSVTGPSGSGKSTLLLTIGGMSSPTGGKVLAGDESIYDWESGRRAGWRAKTIGFVFQTFNLMPYLTVFENISIALDLSGNKEVNDEHIFKISERMKLSDRLEHFPGELSVGQQQRVALARALIKNPQLILADEPTGNLDPQTAGEIINILKEMNEEGRTVVLVTHDPDLAKIANRGIRIVDGESIS